MPTICLPSLQNWFPVALACQPALLGAYCCREQLHRLAEQNQGKVASFAVLSPPSRVGLGGPLPPHDSFSPQSDNSYDFLSAEEKECLLFLEKTIGSLEAEADSGLSTDESEPATSPGSFRALPITQQAPQGKRLSRVATLRRPMSPSEHSPPRLPSAASS